MVFVRRHPQAPGVYMQPVCRSLLNCPGPSEAAAAVYVLRRALSCAAGAAPGSPVSVSSRGVSKCLLGGFFAAAAKARDRDGLAAAAAASCKTKTSSAYTREVSVHPRGKRTPGISDLRLGECLLVLLEETEERPLG